MKYWFFLTVSSLFSFLWFSQWLWLNFSPLEENETGGISKDALIRELLATKEVNKPDNPQAGVFAKALIGRYLCILFKDSVQCKNRFTDPSQPNVFTIKRLDQAAREVREKDVPDFPQDLRVKILKELREERLGRTSARNLLQLMNQHQQSSDRLGQPSPSKKPRTESEQQQQSQKSPSAPSAESEQENRAIPPLVSGEKQQQESADLNPNNTTKESSSDSASPTAENGRVRPMKRALSLSSGDLATSLAGQNGRPAQRPRTDAASSPSLTSSSGGLNAAAAGASRMLRKQVSQPVLPTQRSLPSGLFIQQEPWKREINELWAKQLAMIREINTLKVELSRREAARQREILSVKQEIWKEIRQEMDSLRGKPFLPILPWIYENHFPHNLLFSSFEFCFF